MNFMRHEWLVFQSLRWWEKLILGPLWLCWAGFALICVTGTLLLHIPRLVILRTLIGLGLGLRWIIRAVSQLP
jgi:hypothetical protein